MNSVAGTSTLGVSAKVISRTGTVPWLSWAGLIASICISSGIYWDISWHETIGRDTFWTPAHLLTQFGAVLAGLASSWVIFGTTLAGSSESRQNSVNVLGFRAPLGAFILAWGAAAMLTSAPFDNWWHDAYGLDVKIISPPHILLALGIFGVNWGAAFLASAEMSRAQGAQRRVLQYVLLGAAGFVLIQTMVLLLEQTGKVGQHSAITYAVVCFPLPFLLETFARASEHRWGRTIVAGTYTLFCVLMVWILPLFPAQPKLGPVYQKVTHMVPLPFPLLIVVPAFFLDLIWPRLKQASTWVQAAVAGVVFLAALIAVQWPFATFMMSPAANNWFFANTDFPYFAQPEWPEVRHVFVLWETTALAFWRTIGIAVLASILSVRVGMAFGDWFHRVKR
jgi:hypothetical protein